MIGFSSLAFLLVLFSSGRPTVAQDEESEEPSCEATASLQCPGEEFLLNGMASRNQFFSDMLGCTCSKIDEVIFSEEEIVYTFYSPDGGLSLSASCPNEEQAIVSVNLCVSDSHATSVEITCKYLRDPEKIESTHQATSKDNMDVMVNCGESSVIQGMEFVDAGDGVATSVTFRCIKLSQPEMEDSPEDSE